MQLSVQLIRGYNGILVDANLVKLAQKHVDDYENLWIEQLRLHQSEDKYWDWLFKLRFIISRQENYEGYAIEYENLTEGLMMIETQMHGSQITRGKRLVYIYGVATGPWNRKNIQNPPKFKGIGTTLIDFARNRSLELGYEGRVGLHSLPRAQGFYNRISMIDLGVDEDYDDLIYFEYGAFRSR